MGKADNSTGIIASVSDSAFLRWLERLVNVEPNEVRGLLWAFAYFFSLLCSYYIIRPIRDEMGIAGGVENLQWLFTGTFLVMVAVVPVFGWVTSRFPRRQFLPYVYYFFITNLLVFFILLTSGVTHAYAARTFYIWVSVFNLFVVSVFWSFMADIFTNDQAKRLFAFIAAGGTTGALAGPLLTTTLVGILGPINLLLFSAVLLGCAVLCIQRLSDWQAHQVQSAPGASKAQHKTGADEEDRGLRGGIWAGIQMVLRSPYLLGICVLVLLYTTLSTFLYFQQAQIIRDSFRDSSTRTAVFAGMDLAVNALTIICQVFLTGRIVHTVGIAWTLAVIPLITVAGFLCLALAPVLIVLVSLQVVRRAGNYALMRPAREMLFVVVNREEKYKAKNFIDTAVYRAGDVASAWVYTGLKGLGLSLAAIALMAVPLAGIWGWVAFTLGRKQEKLATQRPQ